VTKLLENDGESSGIVQDAIRLVCDQIGWV
jgi:hypothetical protein